MSHTVPQIQVELTLQRPRSGRTVPVGYRPHFRVSNGEYLGVEIVGAAETSGTATLATVRLLYYPHVNYDALSAGTPFEVLEGPTVVGHGRVVMGHAAI